MKARWYDPEVGRFMSRDPVVREFSAPQSINAYSYVENNPINRLDPEGLETTCAVINGIYSCVTTAPLPQSGGGRAGSGSGAPCVRCGVGGEGGGGDVVGVEAFAQLFGALAGGFGKDGDRGGRVGEPNQNQGGYIPAPPELIGTREYYDFRYERAADSYRNGVGREYYREFGRRKFDDFQRLRESASSELKGFIDRAARELQLELERRVRNDPSIGLQRDTLFRVAFDTHSEAYRAAGFQSLPIRDQLRVVETIGLRDLIRPETTGEIIETLFP